MSALYTTFKLLRAAGACKPRYRHLAKALGGIRAYGDETPILLLKVLEVCGLEDTCWVIDSMVDRDTSLRAMPYDQRARARELHAGIKRRLHQETGWRPIYLWSAIHNAIDERSINRTAWTAKLRSLLEEDARCHD